MANKATNKVIGKATQGRRILNENIKRDYARLLQIAVTPDDEVNFEEIEELANKYRYYFDDDGNVREAQ